MPKRLLFSCLSCSLLLAPIHVFANNLSGQSRAGCTSLLPNNMQAMNNLKICHSTSLSGKHKPYACQDVVTTQGQYRIHFNGGPRARIITRLDKASNINKILWPVAVQAVSQPSCHIPTPSSVPAGSNFQGAGICKDDNDEDVACAIFRHRAPRMSKIHDYLVLYHNDGSGEKQTTPVSSRANHDAFPAELAFQIGNSLVKTSCCQIQGLRYLEQAYQLFPDSSLYRNSYQFFAQRIFHDSLSQVVAVSRFTSQEHNEKEKIQ